jgi:hypothetical protein
MGADDRNILPIPECPVAGASLPGALRAMKLPIDCDRPFDLASPTIKPRYGQGEAGAFAEGVTVGRP